MTNLTHLWKVGQNVRYCEEEFGRKTWLDGVITETHEDHVIATIDGNNYWFEEGLNLDRLYPSYN